MPLRLPAALMLLALLAACSLEGDAESRAVVDRYYASFGAGDINGVLGLYSDRFYSATPRADWSRTLHGMHDRCGAVRSHKLLNWSQSRQLFSDGDSGSRSTLVYDVTYDSCEVTEAFTISRPEDGTPKIMSQSIKVRQQRDIGVQTV
jgi:hypothetical protein